MEVENATALRRALGFHEVGRGIVVRVAQVDTIFGPCTRSPPRRFLVCKNRFSNPPERDAQPVKRVKLRNFQEAKAA